MATLFLVSCILGSFTKCRDQCQTLNDIFNKAKHLLKQQNYVEAYRIFHELGETHIFEQPQCSFYQIQCLIQLQHYRHAIQTCQRQIKRQPKVKEWYLLASDIFMQQHDYTLAWEVLHQAPINCHEVTLRKRIAYEAIQQRWSNHMVKRTDILEKVPYDIATLIFYFLDLESLVKCTRVSKRWRQFLVNNSQLWNELTFEKKASNLDIATIDAYLERLGRAPLTRLIIRHQQTDGDRILLTLAERQCLKLKSLVEALVLSGVVCTPGLFFNALEYMGSTLNTLQWGGVSIRLNELIDILSTCCPHLTHLKLHDCFTSLYDLRMQNGSRYRLETFGETLPTSYIQTVQALPKMDSLQSLELSSIHGLNTSHLANTLFRCQNLKSLTLQNCLVDIIPVLNILNITCLELQNLFYDRNQHYRQYDLFQQTRLLQQQPYLPTLVNRMYPWFQLKIHLTHMLTDPIMSHLLEGSTSTLQVLDLRGNTMITDRGLLGAPMRNLKTLCLKECTGITSQALILLISGSPLLEHVDLSDLSIVNDKVLKQLSECRSLQTLNLSKSTLSITDEVYKDFIDRKKDTLKKIDLENTNISYELLCYSMRKLKARII